MTTWVERGQLVLGAEVLEHLLEAGDDEDEQDREHADEDDDDDARVDHRAADLAPQLHGLLDVDREPIQDGVEDAADLAGLDEVHVEVVEDLGWRRSESLNVAPCSTLDFTSRRMFAKSLLSVCPCRMSRHCTMGRPASIMVANRRVKVTMSLGLTPVPSWKVN